MQIPKAAALKGARLSSDNAFKLLESAAQLSKSGHRSVATAICVLSCEESSKATALIACADGVNSPQFLKEVFRNHRIKHALGHASASHVQKLLAETGFAIELSRETPTGSEIARKLELWKHNADRLKQRGLYVDFSQGKWFTPSGLTEHDFHTSLLAAALALLSVKALLGRAASRTSEIAA